MAIETKTLRERLTIEKGRRGEKEEGADRQQGKKGRDIWEDKKKGRGIKSE